LRSSNTYYQKILDFSEEKVFRDEKLRSWYYYYSLPYYYKAKPGRVLIVGSGVGNDVVAAVNNGAGKVDAVEIDPAIIHIGKKLHPQNPYQADNVNVYADDARSFIRNTKKKYDVIIYGLLDSHSLLSGRSGNIRLDSYVYTVEAFREAREKLNPGGIINLAFCVLDKRLGRKLFLMLQEAFDGESPMVFNTGYSGKNGRTFVAGKNLNRDHLRRNPVFTEVTAEFADEKIQADKSTDDWPFFYMPERRYPFSYIAIILVLIAVSAGYIRKSVPGSSAAFSVPCFFLGVGFMLVETKGITELALVYGSTWVVTSIVIMSILIMSFLANLLVMKKGSPPPLITYSLLFASLIIGLGSTFLKQFNLSPAFSQMIMPAVLTLPLFFSGFAFSAELKKADSVAVALSSNLLGAMLGGFVEYNSMYFGFRSLYVFALVMYGLAFLGSTRVKS
jgi:SAM-dependent methyltransferase